jgi:hypothetical protein
MQEVIGEAVRPSDGFFLINEFRVERRRAGLPAGLCDRHSLGR